MMTRNPQVPAEEAGRPVKGAGERAPRPKRPNREPRHIAQILGELPELRFRLLSRDEHAAPADSHEHKSHP
jgi:hypothetical protein